MIKATIPIRERKQRSRTFTGCWTCRSRRIKCDEARPICTRCLKSGRECGGYDFRLSWDSDDDLLRTRRIAIFQNDETWKTVLSPEELNTALDALENAEPGTDDIRGPFSVFNISNSLKISPPVTPTEEQSKASSSVDDNQSVRSCSISSFETTKTLESSIGSTKETDASSFGPVGIACATDLSAKSHTVPQTSLTRSENLNSHPVGQVVPSLYRQSLDYQQLPIRQRRLIYHWVTHLSDDILPVPGIWRPTRGYFTPAALHAISVSTPQSSNISIALFHGICEASACQLAILTGNDSEMHALATKHRLLSLLHLRKNIVNIHPSENVTMLALCIMFVINQAISGKTDELLVHLRGICDWMAGVDPKCWTESYYSRMNYQGIIMMVIMIQTGLVITGKRIDIQVSDLVLREKYFLEEIVGLPLTVLCAISTINHYLLDPTSVTSRELDLIEIELQAPLPAVPHTLTLSDRDRLFIYHNTRIYCYATLIYFKRAVRHTNVVEVQNLVALALDHLEAIQSLASLTGGQPYVWPIMMIGFEASRPDLQARVSSWTRSRTASGYLNAHMTTMAMEQIWRVRASKPENWNLSWQSICRYGMEVVTL